MSKKKGAVKTGGRQKGTPNKATQTLRAKARELGADPFEILLLFAKGDWQRLGYTSGTVTHMTKAGPIEIDLITPGMRLAAASDACQYLEPKRKPVDRDAFDDAILVSDDSELVQLGREAIRVLENKGEPK